ncbi:MAG: fumarylacetoacetate hydrolase family protein [SAR324 cluster bacterium]|nr:fumarylacetoacetate hydrolase family protein [SAR324 cluster bacterium]
MKSIIIGDRNVIPSKIICIGRNYVEHITELQNEVPDDMVVFLKPNSAISEELVSFHQEQIHYEGELCFMYENSRFSAIGFGLDLTKRQLQSTLKHKGLPWERAKAFDGSALFGDFVAIADQDQNYSFELFINDQLVQAGNIDLMIHKPEQILKELRSFMSLEDGDILMTGTPKGVGVVNKNDKFSGRVMVGNKIITSVEWIAR